MAALQCEICGGKLIGKPGGLFECESCGMEYNTDWARAKIQEIKGTVKVEGTVEVKGTVQVDNSATFQSLIKRGFSELADHNLGGAIRSFTRAQDIDAEWGDIYVGLLMCGHEVWDRATFRQKLLDHEWDQNDRLKKILTLPGSEQLAREVADYQAKLRQEAVLREENARRGQERAEELKILREKYAPVLRRISDDGRAILDSRGNLYFPQEGRGYITDNEDYPRWTNLLSISGCGNLIAIHADGNVEVGVAFHSWDYTKQFERIEAFSQEDGVCQAAMIQANKACLFAGLREDGTVITSKYILSEYDAEKLECGISRENMAQIGGWGTHMVGLSRDGVVSGTEERLSGIASIAEGFYLKTDGTATTQETRFPGYWNRIRDWSELIQISGDRAGAAGLRADGTVVYTNASNDETTHSRQREVASWRNIVAVRAVGDSILGVKSDGSLVTAGPVFATFVKKHPNFRVFENLETLDEDMARQRRAAFAAWKEAEQERLAEEERVRSLREPLEAELEQIHKELANLKGIFTMKRRKELETRMGVILLELDELKNAEDE